MKIKILLIPVFFLLVLTACENRKKKKETATAESGNSETASSEIDIKYAKGFKVKDVGAYRLVDVQDPLG